MKKFEDLPKPNIANGKQRFRIKKPVSISKKAETSFSFKER